MWFSMKRFDFGSFSVLWFVSWFSTRSERLLFDSLAGIVFSSFFALHFVFVRCVASRFIPCTPSVSDTVFALARGTMGGPVGLLLISLHP
jgi:hypothetical protein